MKLIPTQNPAIDGTKEIPFTHDLKKYLLPFATSSQYRQFPFGAILLQKFISEKIKIFSYHFFAQVDSSFYAMFEEPTIALQFMTAGSVEALLQGLDTPLNTGHFGLFFLPASINEVKLPKGFSHSIHFELTEAYLNDLTALHPEVQDLLVKFFNATQKAERLAPAPFTSEVKNLLGELMQLKVPAAALDFKLKYYIITFLEIYRNALAANVAVLSGTPYEEIIKKLGEAIQHNPDKRLYKVSNLSAQYLLSEYVIKKVFLQVWQQTLPSFIYTHGMEKACRLLLTTNLNITKIADAVGYENDSNFTKAFKQYTNESPGKWRRKKS